MTKPRVSVARFPVGECWFDSHEYDHANGYDGENQLYVEPVCTTCHHAREEARGG